MTVNRAGGSSCALHVTDAQNKRNKLKKVLGETEKATDASVLPPSNCSFHIPYRKMKGVHIVCFLFKMLQAESIVTVLQAELSAVFPYRNHWWAD